MYSFLDSNGSVLYVGKAKNLKNRIAQYRQLAQLPPQKRRLVQTAHTVQYTVYESELSALLAEAELIRLYRPPYNILLKDDKSPLYIVITNERFPRVLTARRQELVKGKVEGEIFGPYQSAYMAKQVLRAVRPAFRWCSVAGKRAPDSSDRRPCFYYHLGLCSGACVGECTPDQYRGSMRRLKQFLRGESEAVQKQLKRDIESLAEQQRYEEAEEHKQELQAMQRLLEPSFRLGPDLFLVKSSAAGRERLYRQMARQLRLLLGKPKGWLPQRIEAFDVSNFSGKLATVAQVVAIEGVPNPSQYRLFNIRSKDTPDDYTMMNEALRRRQNHPEWGTPDLVIIDGGKGQVNAVLADWHWAVPVIGLAKEPDRLVIPQENGEFLIVPVEELGESSILLSHLRDEAHRFSKKQVHRRLANRDIPR